ARKRTRPPQPSKPKPSSPSPWILPPEFARFSQNLHRPRSLSFGHQIRHLRSRKAVTIAQSSPPPAQPSSAATAPALMDHLPVGPGGSQALASSALSVLQPVSAKRHHRPASTIDATSTGNYNLEDLDDESLAYVNRLFAGRYKQWKSDLHHHFEAFDDPQVALQEGCPKELDVREDICGSSTGCWVSHLGRRPGTYCRGMGNARRREPRPRSSAQSNSQVTALTAKVVELQGQMLVILESRNLMRRPLSPSTPS
ncbi:unnamed protein product, partial [Prunus brigantina]